MRKDINHHTLLLNYLIEKHDLKSYLELGVQNPANNFYKINTKFKHAVDPCLSDRERVWVEPAMKWFFSMTSDKYFSPNNPVMVGNNYDLIFIDGDHTKEQVKRDFENSLRCLNENGFIVIHDTLPLNEQGTRVPRETKQWWGDVYKFAFELNLYPGIDFCTYDFDNGCTVVWKTDKDLSIMQLPEVDYEFYLNNKHLLRLKDCVD